MNAYFAALLLMPWLGWIAISLQRIADNMDGSDDETEGEE